MTAVDNWQEKFKQIYPNKNLNEDYIMAHIFTKCAEIGRRLLRANNDSSIDRYVIGALAWTISLSNKLEISFRDSLIDRYPLVCNYCINKPCICDQTGMKAKVNGLIITDGLKIDEELSYKRQTLSNNPPLVNFKWIFQQINEIYPINRALIRRGAEGFVVSKMLEEGGELHRAYSQHKRGLGNKVQIQREIADLTAWVISCWDIGGAGEDLDNIFSQRFAMGCPDCGNAECICPPYSITPGHEELVRKIAELLRELRQTGLANEQLDEALLLADDAQTKADITKAKNLKDKISSIVDTTKQVDQASTSVASIGSRLIKLADLLLTLF